MIIYTINIVLLLIFLISFLHDRRKLVNGLLFFILLFFCGLSLIYSAITTNNKILLFITYFLAIVFVLVMLFGLFIIMIISLINAAVLIKKEGRKLTNLLSFFVSIAIFGWLLLNTTNLFNIQSFPHYPLLLSIINSIGFYFLIIFAIYILSSFIYKIYRPRLLQDYIIVLGAGLLNGESVTPLLARRIDRAINLFKKQLNRKNKPIMLIMSGGKGNDEKVSEADAMKQYALQKGIPEKYILIEDQSRNTYENMKLSKNIITERESRNKIYVLFATSNYHVFRAGIYARKEGLKAQGIGARTPFYFWYNAILREYVAILIMYRKIQAIILFFITMIVYIIYYLLTNPDTLKAVLNFFGIM